MAGNPQPAPRRSPPPTTQADKLAGASRDAAATDWGVPPKKSGVRGEVKLALMLIITLAGAFGYIVHRKFGDLRKEAIAAESFKSLPTAQDPRAEITLPPANSSESFLAAADPLAANADPVGPSTSAPPTLAVSSAAPPAVNDPFPTAPPTEVVAAANRPADDSIGLPFPSFEQQSEPAPFQEQSASPQAASELAPTAPTAATAADDPFATLASSTTAVPAAVESSPFPSTEATVDPVPFQPQSAPVTPAEMPTVAAAAPAAGDTPLDLFGPLPTTAAAPVVEPTFDPAADSLPFPTSPPPIAQEPALAEPALADSVNSSPAQTEPAFSPEPLPTRTPAAVPARVEPNWEPTPAAPAVTAPPRVVAADDPFPSTISPPASTEPLFPESPVSRAASDDPFGGPNMPTPRSLTQDQPVPTSPASLLDQSIPTSPDPNWPAAAIPPVARTDSPAEPAWPDSAPTLPREQPLFSDPPAAAATAFIPDTVPTPSATAADNLYTIRPGDNYWVIAKAHYGSVRYFAALTEYNRDRIPDPQKMKPGLQVAIPAADVLESRFPNLFTGTVPSVAATQPTVSTDGPGQFFVSAGEPMYRVGQGDTLSSIAQKHLGRASRWEQVFTMNRDALPSPDRLKPGTILRLPRDASQIAVTPEGANGR